MTHGLSPESLFSFSFFFLFFPVRRWLAAFISSCLHSSMNHFSHLPSSSSSIILFISSSVLLQGGFFFFFYLFIFFFFSRLPSFESFHFFFSLSWVVGGEEQNLLTSSLFLYRSSDF
jgi:hypothetical protein